jgi:hypothetical protein
MKHQLLILDSPVEAYNLIVDNKADTSSVFLILFDSLRFTLKLIGILLYEGVNFALLTKKGRVHGLLIVKYM